MPKKQKIALEEKVGIVRACIGKEISICEAARKVGVSFTTVKSWIRIYENEGAGGFTYQANKVYSSELKTAAVLDYLKGKGSHHEICKKYGIRGRQTLERVVFGIQKGTSRQD